MTVHLCDELPFAFGWLDTEPAWMRRAAHAIAEDGRVWVIDPFDAEGMEERVRALGEPAGVVQLLDRHERDCAAWARRLGVPHHEVPVGHFPGAPFEVISVLRTPVWREVALWWPQTRTLVCADALAAARGYRAPGELVAVHPLMRLWPPRALARPDVEHLLLGHGEGLQGETARRAISEAMDTSRRRIPRFVRGLLPGATR